MRFTISSKTSIDEHGNSRKYHGLFDTRGWIGALLIALPIALPCVVGAQSASDSAFYVQAQQMVANGDAASGRKLADSVAAAAPAGSVAFAEGLYWRATLAENARDSEHEYRQIIVDYPLSGRVPDALLRIGQLESARGENAAALQHFQRLVLEHPQSPLHADASYWVARMYFDTNDATHGCSANADAHASVRPSNIELKNRIDFQQQRCRGVVLSTNSAPAPVASPVASRVSKAPPVEAPKATAKTVPKAVPKAVVKVVVAPPVVDHADSNVDATVAIKDTRDTRDTKAASKTTAVVSRPPTKEEVARALASAEQPAIKKIAKANMHKAKPSKSRKATVTPVPAQRRSTRSAVTDESTPISKSFSVQVAAFGTRPPATLLVAKLRGRGYDAYIDGTSAPYRVRIGHYPTHDAASVALVKLRARQIDGFVAER